MKGKIGPFRNLGYFKAIKAWSFSLDKYQVCKKIHYNRTDSIVLNWYTKFNSINLT